MKPGLNDKRGKVSSTAMRKPGSKGREEETEKLGLLSTRCHCLRNDLESKSWEVCVWGESFIREAESRGL